MKFLRLLPSVTAFFSTLGFGGRNPKLGKLDFGILQVALMVAALDGEILSGEYEAFDALAKRSRGYTATNARRCLDEALRRGGYLMAIAKIGGYTERQRIDAFVDLAIEAMPRGFADGELSDLRRAFVLWVAMGVSDGEFSDLERSALEALQDRLAQVMQTGVADQERRWGVLSQVGGATSGKVRRITLLEGDFLERAETLVRRLAVAQQRERAEAELAEFIEG